MLNFGNRETILNDDIFARYYALNERISNGYVPTQVESDFLDFASEKIADWSSDVEQPF